VLANDDTLPTFVDPRRAMIGVRLNSGN